MDYKELGSKLKSFENVYLYGAGIVAYSAYKAIDLLFNIKIKGYIVTNTNNEADVIDNISVFDASIISSFNMDTTNKNINKNIDTTDKDTTDKNTTDNTIILVATPIIYHYDIEQTLKKYDFENYILLDASLEYELMCPYFRKVNNYITVEDIDCSNITSDINKEDVGVYMACCHKDTPLANKYEDYNWVTKVQGGADLTDIRMADELDNLGDNISKLNHLYSEMSVSYYVWKNKSNNIKGIFHYRRNLDISTKHINLLNNNTVDVILPLPFICFPNTYYQYLRYVKPVHIEVMVEVLKEFYPEYSDKLISILESNYIYNYNMMVTRKDIFDDYCNWTFPVLEKVIDVCHNRNIEFTNRFVSYLSEAMTSLYFVYNSKYGSGLRVAHARKVWRV